MKLLRFFLPRMEYILFAAIFWGIAASGPRILNFDGDLPRHILTGNLILQTRHVPTTDLFSFRTAGYPSYPHEWFSQVIFAAVYNWLGLDGIVLLTALVIMLTWAIVFSLTIRKSQSLFVSLLFVALALAASQIHVLPRPHIFTYLLSAVWIMVLEAGRENNSRIWWMLPIVMLLWANMHGMFVLGVIILLIYLIGDFLDHPSIHWFTSPKTRVLLLASGGFLIATMISPTGPQIWEAIASLGSNEYIISKIPEYQSPNFHLPETWPFILLLLLVIMGFARTTERVSWIHTLLVISFTSMALYTSRMIPLFAIVVTPVAAQVIASWMRKAFAPHRFFAVEQNLSKTNSDSNGLIWIFAFVIIAAIFLKSGRPIDAEGRGNVFDPSFFPVEAAAWLETHPPQGHMFNEFDWGGYLLLKLWPAHQIFMDGHTHIYGEALTREYEQVITLNTGWEKILKKYDIQWVIMRRNSPLAKALSAQEEWSIAYQDATAIIVVHK